MTTSRLPAEGAIGKVAPSAGDGQDTPERGEEETGNSHAARDRQEPQRDAGAQPGAAGREAWRQAISDLHAQQARGRKWAKRPRNGGYRAGGNRRMPGGGG